MPELMGNKVTTDIFYKRRVNNQGKWMPLNVLSSLKLGCFYASPSCQVLRYQNVDRVFQ